MAHIPPPLDVMNRARDRLYEQGDRVKHYFGERIKENSHRETRKYIWYPTAIDPQGEDLTQDGPPFERSVFAMAYEAAVLISGRTYEESDAMLRNLQNAISFICEADAQISQKIEVLSDSVTGKSMAYLLRFEILDQVREGYIPLDPLGDLPDTSVVVTSFGGTVNELPPVVEVP